MRAIFLSSIAFLVFATSGEAQLGDKVADRLFESAKVVDELIQAPDSDIPKELLSRAECVAVIPAVKKAAIGVGGNYGRGVVSCRKDAGKGPWGPPSMISLSGGSFGFQLGGQSTDVVMLFMTPDSIKHLLKDKVTLGADASAAAGPKGREASAQTNATMRAEILTYARSRGLFAGISLKGAVLKPDGDANKSLYNRDVDAKELLLEGKGNIPDSAKKFVDTLTRTTAGS
jgi:lipid-binding SYLF domain-containing protein